MRVWQDIAGETMKDRAVVIMDDRRALGVLCKHRNTGN